jgi:transcriptional regulator with XRE-family HTH domain
MRSPSPARLVRAQDGSGRLRHDNYPGHHLIGWRDPNARIATGWCCGQRIEKGIPVNERHSPGLNKRRLGRLLTRFREDAGLTLAQAAEALYTSRSAMNRLENGGTRVNVHILKSMLDLYDIGGDRWPGLIEMAVRAGQKGWWHQYGQGVAGTYVDFETEVDELFMFGLAVVPGLLQTAEYARTMFREYYPGRRRRRAAQRRRADGETGTADG